jgi:hypothetical protein
MKEPIYNCTLYSGLSVKTVDIGELYLSHDIIRSVVYVCNKLFLKKVLLRLFLQYNIYIFFNFILLSQLTVNSIA